MRWRFVDRVARFEAWAAIEGRKAISFEEYSLLKPFGRKGFFPETLALESCVELVRWLVAASSGFQQATVLSQVEDFRFEREVGMGEALQMSATITQRDEKELRIECSISSAGQPVGRGALSVAMQPLAEGFDRECVETMWRELYGAA